MREQYLLGDASQRKVDKETAESQPVTTPALKLKTHPA